MLVTYPGGMEGAVRKASLKSRLTSEELMFVRAWSNKMKMNYKATSGSLGNIDKSIP
jgi:hypothetical protein